MLEAVPEECPVCGSVFIQAEPWGLMKVVRCLVRGCTWHIEVDPSRVDRSKVKNIYLRTTL